MLLKFSHIDVLVRGLDAACAYYRDLFAAEVSATQVWERDGLHVRYAIVRLPEAGAGASASCWSSPFAAICTSCWSARARGCIYRHCYSTPDIELAYDTLLARGVQPEDELGRPLTRERLSTPSGARILWLPKRFGQFSIELLQEDELERFIAQAFGETAKA